MQVRGAECRAWRVGSGCCENVMTASSTTHGPCIYFMLFLLLRIIPLPLLRSIFSLDTTAVSVHVPIADTTTATTSNREEEGCESEKKVGRFEAW